MADKKGRMTDRERVEALLRRERPDRVPILPIVCGFCTLYAAALLPMPTITRQCSSPRSARPVRILNGILSADGLSHRFWLRIWRRIKWPSGDFAQAPMITRYPVDTLEDVFNLKMPDVKTAGTVPIRIELCKMSSQERLDNEPFNMMAWLGGVFTNTAQIPGVEKMSKWTLKKPEAAHHLMRMGTDYLIELTKYWKDTFGTEGVLPFFGSRQQPIRSSHLGNSSSLLCPI